MSTGKKTEQKPVKTELIKELREKTGVAIMDCKRALEEAGGDLQKAEEILRQMGKASAQKKASRATSQGIISSYVHFGGRVGVLLELNCETDFVAKNEAFQELARNLCMQVAALRARYVSRQSVPAEELQPVKARFEEEARKMGKPAQVIPKIVEGKLEKFYAEVCLLDQAYIKNEDLTIQDLVKEHIQKFGENIQIGRFVRYEIGETA